MSMATYEALIVHGGGLTAQEKLPDKVAQRMDTAISAWEEGAAPKIVVSGDYSFMLNKPPSVSEAEVMRQYALNEGVSNQDLYIEDKSLDTIGNVLFTKTRIVIPNDWERLMVVTSQSHLPRTLKIFRHIMGNDFEIRGMPSPERVTAKERVYEFIGSVVMREVLRGTKPGDDEAIKERLFDLVPGYVESTKGHLAVQSLLGLIKPQ